ncbi:MAG: ABC transporter permease [Candidatus Latescibacterota bacterium]|jgi:phospholipid/cholesterol/gamma-HCH transport system permease protein
MKKVVRRTALGILARFGRSAEVVAGHAGGMSLLAWRVTGATLTGRVALRDVLNQLVTTGVASVPLVLLTSVLSGIVTSQQGGYQFTGAVPLYVLGSVVTESIVLELGPVMTAFVLIGRVGARIAAELGTMKVSEQIDALYSLGRDPVPTLAAPRIIAMTIATPLLVGMSNLVGLGSAMISSRLTMGLGFETFLYGARLFWHSWDLLYSLIKGLAFGYTIPLISVYMGLDTRGGAEGVGRATTLAVVTMIVTVLVIDAVYPPPFLN